MDNYNLDAIMKKKRKNLYNRLHAAGKDYFWIDYDSIMAVKDIRNRGILFV